MPRLAQRVCWLFSFGVAACSLALDEKEYISFVRDLENGLHVIKEVNEFVFDVQYQPMDYLAISRNPNDLQPDNSLQYYLLNVGVKGSKIDIEHYKATNEAELQQTRYYFSYHFQNDIQLEERGQVLPCLLFHAEQSLKEGNFKTFVLAFENKFPDSEESKLVITSDLFGSLPVKIKILKTTPRLRKL